MDLFSSDDAGSTDYLSSLKNKNSYGNLGLLNLAKNGTKCHKSIIKVASLNIMIALCRNILRFMLLHH